MRQQKDISKTKFIKCETNYCSEQLYNDCLDSSHPSICFSCSQLLLADSNKLDNETKDEFEVPILESKERYGKNDFCFFDA